MSLQYICRRKTCGQNAKLCRNYLKLIQTRILKVNTEVKLLELQYKAREIMEKIKDSLIFLNPGRKSVGKRDVDAKRQTLSTIL